MPAAQATQVTWADMPEYQPGAQVVQTLALTVEYRPATQSTQATDETEPVTPNALPAKQFRHATDPVEDMYMPTAQFRQVS